MLNGPNWLVREIVIFSFFYCATIFIKISNFTGRLSGGLTPYVESKVQKSCNKSYNCNARRLYGDTFEVDDNFATSNVQLERRVCSCGKWQKSGIPCGHAIACLRTRTSESIHRMVDYKFTNYVYRLAYGSELVNTIPSHVHWEIPNETVVLLPPSMQ